MKFQLYKLIDIDNAKVHCVGIFTIISNDGNEGKYFATYFTDAMKPSIEEIKSNNLIEEPSILHYIFEGLVKEKPHMIFSEPEDALIYTFKQLYKQNEAWYKKQQTKKGEYTYGY